MTVDPFRGTDDVSGVVFIFLIFPTLFFCFLPFSIYDFIPLIFSSSITVLEYFKKPPSRTWYLALVLCTVALFFNFSTVTYFYKRDPISLLQHNSTLSTVSNHSSCQTGIQGLTLPMVICSIVNLKVGFGRMYFKAFILFGGIITSLMYIILVTYILGMRYR